jgi:hypothetical protein
MKKFIAVSLLTTSMAITAPLFANPKVELSVTLPQNSVAATANFDVGNNVELFAGLGGIVYSEKMANGDREYAADSTYSLGAKYYVGQHIRLTAGYGVIGNIISKESYSSDDIDMNVVNGKYLGIGYFSTRNRGIVADLNIVDVSAIDDRSSELCNIDDNDCSEYIAEKNDNLITFSIGYRF